MYDTYILDNGRTMHFGGEHIAVIFMMDRHINSDRQYRNRDIDNCAQCVRYNKIL